MQLDFDLTQLLTQLLIFVLTAAAAWITKCLIPWLKANASDKQQEILRKVCNMAVIASEQMNAKDYIDNKLGNATTIVLKELEKFGLKFDGEIIRNAIEAEAKKLKDGCAYYE